LNWWQIILNWWQIILNRRQVVLYWRHNVHNAVWIPGWRYISVIWNNRSIGCGERVGAVLIKAIAGGHVWIIDVRIRRRHTGYGCAGWCAGCGHGRGRGAATGSSRATGRAAYRCEADDEHGGQSYYFHSCLLFLWRCCGSGILIVVSIIWRIHTVRDSRSIWHGCSVRSGGSIW
jgi:hypothetical protein